MRRVNVKLWPHFQPLPHKREGKVNDRCGEFPARAVAIAPSFRNVGLADHCAEWRTNSQTMGSKL